MHYRLQTKKWLLQLFLFEPVGQEINYFMQNALQNFLGNEAGFRFESRLQNYITQKFNDKSSRCFIFEVIGSTPFEGSIKLLYFS